jgi:methylthioribose-1-phosphate isomerase
MRFVGLLEESDSVQSILNTVVDYAESMLAADIKDNQSIGQYGKEAIINLCTNAVIIIHSYT